MISQQCHHGDLAFSDKFMTDSRPGMNNFSDNEEVRVNLKMPKVASWEMHDPPFVGAFLRFFV